jgi:hypothetical protein
LIFTYLFLSVVVVTGLGYAGRLRRNIVSFR